MRVAWLGGWAIAPEAMLAAARQRWPEAEHVAVTPGAGWAECLTRTIANSDRLVAYSLGGFLLLRSPETFIPAERVALVAPFLDLRQHLHLGGRVEEVRLRYMIRRLARNPRACVADFYQSAGLEIGMSGDTANDAASIELPYSVDDLAWGLEQLYRPLGEPRIEAFRGCTALVGSEDPLIDAARLAELWPEVRPVRGAGHALAPLLEAVT